LFYITTAILYRTNYHHLSLQQNKKNNKITKQQNNKTTKQQNNKITKITKQKITKQKNNKIKQKNPKVI